MLGTPSVDQKQKGNTLEVTVQFSSGSKAQSGRIWWMYDRGPDGSAAYLRDLFPDDQWKDMAYDAKRNVWTAEIELEPGASHIDFFSNYRKTIRYKTRAYATYISSPYTRIQLDSKEEMSS